MDTEKKVTSVITKVGWEGRMGGGDLSCTLDTLLGTWSWKLSSGDSEGSGSQPRVIPSLLYDGQCLQGYSTMS